MVCLEMALRSLMVFMDGGWVGWCFIDGFCIFPLT